MRKLLVSRRPDRNGDFPVWFSPHGSRMEPEHIDLHMHRIELYGQQVPGQYKLQIQGGKSSGMWLVSWWVSGVESHSEGARTFTTEDLRAAFGFDEKSDESGQAIIDRFGGTAARPNLFLRWNDFLNIPFPGTGLDGDPNISIVLSDKIKDAVRRLIE